MKGDEDMRKNTKASMIALAILLAIYLLGCAGTQTSKKQPTVQVSPTKVAISMAIFKTPIVFTGSGWKPGEIVVLDMVVPPEVKIPAVEPGEDAGVGFGKVDEKGNFKCTMGGMTKIITVFRGSLNPETFKPIGKTFKPIPFGAYTIKATGMDSGGPVTTSIEFVKPAPKAKK
jgi:hypothetical protein